MRTDTGQVFRLEDYRPSDYLIPKTGLRFALAPDSTIVTATLTVRRREGVVHNAPLMLDGDGLVLRRVELNGKTLGTRDYTATPDQLVIPAPPEADEFELTIETEIAPSKNTVLMGLYRVEQCLLHAMRGGGLPPHHLFPRPSRHALRLYGTHRAPQAKAPLLLSNGNSRLEAANWATDGISRSGTIPSPSRPTSSRWSPAISASSKTRSSPMSGREVELGIYVEHGKEPRAAYAMDALKRSMKWDEEVFGREYDLDIFMIVAVSDFNMGAMENKGLNVFNDKYVLADPETATDADYANIEAIIAHEYFHNWTGNRITCRDWFQLCLKEGLTVYRDHEFSADQRSRAGQAHRRSAHLKAEQFPEDQGPLAHPVRPRRYREINNFYTTTVYEKGSEVTRMIATMLGAEAFRKGMDLYFERHDGQAVTIEDFVKASRSVRPRPDAVLALVSSGRHAARHRIVQP